MTLADLQWSYNGLTFGDGTDYHVNKAEGFEGCDVRISDSDQPRGDGGIRGLDYVASRLVNFELALMEPDNDGTTYEGLYATVRSTFVPQQSTDLPLTFKRPGQPERFINCRPIQLLRSETYLNFDRVGFPPVVMRAVDPRIYSTALYDQNVPIYASAAGGVDFGLDFGIDFAGGTQTELVVSNAGNANAYPYIRFYGPTTGTCTAVKLTNSTTGGVLNIVTTLLTGDICTADMGAAATATNSLIISTGGSSRYGSWQLPRTPLYLAPGSNNLRFEVTGSTTNAVCNVQWRDTWIS